MNMLSEQSNQHLQRILNNYAETLFDKIYSDEFICDDDYPDAWARVEEETSEQVIEQLKNDFEKTCNDYGFDSFEEFKNEGFLEALIEFVENWKYQ